MIKLQDVMAVLECVMDGWIPICWCFHNDTEKIFVNRDGTLAAVSDRFVVLVGVYRYA